MNDLSHIKWSSTVMMGITHIQEMPAPHPFQQYCQSITWGTPLQAQ
jgi:hypothetical protein